MGLAVGVGVFFCVLRFPGLSVLCRRAVLLIISLKSLKNYTAESANMLWSVISVAGSLSDYLFMYFASLRAY
jgi:hypothetical protein